MMVFITAKMIKFTYRHLNCIDDNGVDAGISRWGGVVRGGAEIRGAITRGGARNFPIGGLNLPTRGLKYCFWGTFT